MIVSNQFEHKVRYKRFVRANCSSFAHAFVADRLQSSRKVSALVRTGLTNATKRSNDFRRPERARVSMGDAAMRVEVRGEDLPYRARGNDL